MMRIGIEIILGIMRIINLENGEKYMMGDLVGYIMLRWIGIR